MLDAAQLLLRLGETFVQARQAPVDEVGQLQPCVDRGAAVRGLGIGDRRYRVQGPDLLDQAQLPVPAALGRRVGVPQPLDLAPQRVGCVGAERLGLDLHPCFGDAHCGDAEDSGPQRGRIQ